MAFIAGVRAKRAACATAAAASDAAEDGANPETESRGCARNSRGACSPCRTEAECAHFGPGTAVEWAHFGARIAARAAACGGSDIVCTVARVATSARGCRASTGVACARAAPRTGVAPATRARAFLQTGTPA